ncbi:MAG: protein of unknown function DUF1905 [Parcubacteria group bacterium Gr01-1014_20]|nr:MAG: protein of unknown function DUF1905 [Parcubacteria group bacterium Gr01-1014_20]
MNSKKEYKIKTNVWLYPGMAGWHFVNLPKKESREIGATFGKVSRGFGSLPVTVTIGKTSWKTSIFPDKKSETYLLPLKAAIRKKERFGNGDHIAFLIKVAV